MATLAGYSRHPDHESKIEIIFRLSAGPICNANNNDFSNHFLLVRRVELSSRPDGLGKVLQCRDGGLPVDARVGDGNTLLQAGWTLGWDLLVALVDVGLDHHTDDGLLAGTELVANYLRDLWLVAVVLV